MNYKNIFPAQSFRFLLLRFFSFIPDRLMLSFQYFLKLNRRIDWKEYPRYTEKLQVYKRAYRNPLMPICVDKYEVRRFIEEKGLSFILNELYGVYDTSNDINYQQLPNSFVIKTTDGSGGQNIVLCKSKKNLNIEETNSNLESWLNKKNINAGREWAYTQMIDSKIIVEKLLVNKENPEAGISDYKIICFKGIPQVIIVDVNRYIDHKRNFYDSEWNYLNVSSDCDSFGDSLEKPDNLDDMLKIASKLSEDFPHVRVDLYNVDNQIIFGEMTFYPWSGYVQFYPDSFDYELGKHFDI